MGDFRKKEGRQDSIFGFTTILAGLAFGPIGFLVAAGAGLGLAGHRKATGAAEVELALAGRKEKLDAADREAKRKRRLVTVLGAQTAAAAASGIAQGGSVGNISVTDAEQASLDRISDRASTRITIDGLARRRSSIRRAGALQSASTILSTGATMVQGIKIDKPVTTPNAPIGRGN